MVGLVFVGGWRLWVRSRVYGWETHLHRNAKGMEGTR